jgi:hypothetical protein
MLDVLDAFRIRFGARPLLLSLAVLGLLYLVSRSGLARPSQERWTAIAKWAIGTAGVAGLVAYAVSAVWYASDPHFFDNAEPTMISVGWLFHAGQPIYHAVDAPERYALIYGPLAYIVHGIALSMFGPNIGVSKALGAAAGLASVALTYAAVRRHETPARGAIAAGIYALILLLFRHYSFWTRPEPFQLCAAAASLVFAVRSRGIAGAIAAGAASGVLWNLKFTGPLYSIPIFVLLHRRAGWRATIAAVVTGVVAAALPFIVFSNVSLADYVAWVRLSARTGLLLSTLRQNLEWTAFLLLPILISHFGSIADERQRDSRDRAVLISLVVGAVGVVVAGAKPGAGPYHLMPFLPAIAYLVSCNTSRISPASRMDAAVSRGAIAFVVVAVAVATVQQTQLTATMMRKRPVQEIADIEAFASTHRGTIAMGYGSTEAASLARPILTFRSNTYLIDQPAVREHQLAGIEVPQSTADAVASCRVDYWLVPKGEAPFSGVNGYAAVLLRPLYPETFRRAFLSTHLRVSETTYYDVWQCQRAGRK